MKWHVAKYGDPYSEFVLCIYPIQSVHTQQWTHTPGAVGSHLCCGARGAVWGFGALLKGTSVVVLRVERALYIHSPHLQSLLDLRLEPATLGYDSDSLTIRPLLPTKRHENLNQKQNPNPTLQHFSFLREQCQNYSQIMFFVFFSLKTETQA